MRTAALVLLAALSTPAFASPTCSLRLAPTNLESFMTTTFQKSLAKTLAKGKIQMDASTLTVKYEPEIGSDDQQELGNIRATFKSVKGTAFEVNAEGVADAASNPAYDSEMNLVGHICSIDLLLSSAAIVNSSTDLALDVVEGKELKESFRTK